MDAVFLKSLLLKLFAVDDTTRVTKIIADRIAETATYIFLFFILYVYSLITSYNKKPELSIAGNWGDGEGRIVF